LQGGVTFPQARQRAAEALIGEAAAVLSAPNNNLGVEYLRALARQGGGLAVHTFARTGAAHDSGLAGLETASASFLRERLLAGAPPASLEPYVSREEQAVLEEAGLASLSYCTRGVLAKLRSMTAEEFRAQPDCAPGLEHRLFQGARRAHSLEELYRLVKTRRDTHARTRRLVLSAFLGIQAGAYPELPPYLRVLGMTERGAKLLHGVKKSARLPILTKPARADRLPAPARRVWETELRATALYDLCRPSLCAAKVCEYTASPCIRKDQRAE
jgi:predicted nucleotidyltransferase